MTVSPYTCNKTRMVELLIWCMFECIHGLQKCQMHAHYFSEYELMNPLQARFVHRHKQNIVNTSQTSMEMVSLGDAYRWKCMQLEPEIKTHSNKAIPAYHCPKKWTGPVHLHTPGHQELMWCSAVFAKVSFLHETTFTSVSSLLPGCIIFPTVIYISWYIRQFISF